MKLNSKIFDSIRVKPDEDRLLRDQYPCCEWAGCEAAGTHRAPKGRGRDGEYLQLCLAHVRQYNKGYNYFEGMKDEDVIGYQKSSLTGHRPTWKLGVNSWATGEADKPGGDDPEITDPFGLFNGGSRANAKPRRTVRNAERAALSALGLDIDATPEQIKLQYKTLVKRHHPDANGGNRESEDKFREVIQAYDYLRSVGYC